MDEAVCRMLADLVLMSMQSLDEGSQGTAAHQSSRDARAIPLQHAPSLLVHQPRGQIPSLGKAATPSFLDQSIWCLQPGLCSDKRANANIPENKN